jgi:hypothetical protein
MRNGRKPLVIGFVVVLLLAGALYLLAGRGTPDDDTGGGMFSAADRDALAARPVERGADVGGPDPAVDLTDPSAVAKAYVVAGYSLRDTDAGHTNRRAVPYAMPGTPPSTVGVLVVAAPAPGQRSAVTVTGVEQVNGEETDVRRGYLVSYRAGGKPAGPRTRYLLLVRQIDGRWLVAGDSADGQVGEP